MPDLYQQETNALVQDLLKEKRADRRWKNIRFIAWFILFVYLVTIIFHYASISTKAIPQNSYVALIRLDGMIAPGRGFSAEDTLPTLQDAFTDKHAAGIILDINSPGGTPVQAAVVGAVRS